MKLAFPSMDGSEWLLKNKTEVTSNMVNPFLPSGKAHTGTVQLNTINKRNDESPIKLIDITIGAKTVGKEQRAVTVFDECMHSFAGLKYCMRSFEGLKDPSKGGGDILINKMVM